MLSKSYGYFVFVVVLVCLWIVLIVGLILCQCFVVVLVIGGGKLFVMDIDGVVLVFDVVIGVCYWM